MNVSEHRFLTHDATALFYRRFAPDGPCAASTLVVHGMGEHGGRYLEFAQAMAGAGIECLIPDLRGYGKSAGRRGDARRLEDFTKDLDALYKLLVRTSAGRPVFLLAHSFGAFLACRLMSETAEVRPRGFILTSPLAEVAVPVPAWKKGLARLASVIFPVYTEAIPLDPKKLTHDTRMHERDSRDPLLHYRVTARLYTQMDRALRNTDAIARKLRGPALLLQAGDDYVVSRSAAERFFQNLGSEDKELVVYPGLYHEILNETTRQSIYSKIISWIIERSK